MLRRSSGGKEARERKGKRVKEAMEGNFENRLKKAVETAKRVLDTTRHPVFLSESSHQYEDKFSVAEQTCGMAHQAMMTVLQLVGLDVSKESLAVAWGKAGRAVTLRFESEESCKFTSSFQSQVDTGVEHVSTFAGIERRSKTVEKVTHHVWKFVQSYRLLVFPGREFDQAIILVERASETELFTKGSEKIAPAPEHTTFPHREVSLAWLLSKLAHPHAESDAASFSFAIDRTAKTCYTPTENVEVLDMKGQTIALSHWFGQVCDRMKHLQDLASVHVAPEARKESDNSARTPFPGATDLFIPILPTFSTTISEEEKLKPGRKPVWSHEQATLFLKEHERQLQERIAKVREIFADPSQQQYSFLSSTEASIHVLGQHLRLVKDALLGALEYLESQLRSQIIQAIGKEVSVEMIDEYMRFYLRKLYLPDIVRPFAYDVKRAGCAPEGTLSITSRTSGGNGVEGGEKEIMTVVAQRSGVNVSKMHFRLNASTTVEMKGPQYVHGYLSHRFSDASNLTELQLSARARQFSSFVLMMGRIVSAEEFEPTSAIILQNKDSVLLSLVLEPLPTPKAFRNAIESLSPEQQEFARAIRAMQLQSTLFAVAVVEIKPQLERLLNLPAGSLTKEIQLTQDLMKLFVEFQIPSDLVTFQGEPDLALCEKISAVKAHVSAILDMVNKQKQAQLQESMQQAQEQVMATLSCRRELDACEDLTEEEWDDEEDEELDLTGCMYFCDDEVESESQSQQQQQQQQEPLEEQQRREEQARLNVGASSGTVDYTRIPARLDSTIEEMDSENALRATKILPDTTWRHTSFPNLISRTPTTTYLSGESLDNKTRAALDLLDALSRSGDLCLEETQLHIVLATTHMFDQTVMDCVLKRNMNPLAKLRQSSLIVSSAILGKSPEQLADPRELQHVPKALQQI